MGNHAFNLYLTPFPQQEKVRGKGLVIRAITFDAGDTLIFDNPTRNERIVMALQSCGSGFEPDALNAALRDMERYAMQRYLEGDVIDNPAVVRECTRILLEGIGAPADTSNIAALAQAYAVIPYDRYLEPDVLNLLEALRNRCFKIGVISDWEPDLPELLEALGCLHLIDCVSVSSIVGATKPSAKLFQHALDQLGVEGSEALHIGDYYELDVAGARAAGMDAILYDLNTRYVSDHLDVPVVRSFDDLSRLLLSLPVP